MRKPWLRQRVSLTLALALVLQPLLGILAVSPAQAAAPSHWLVDDCDRGAGYCPGDATATITETPSLTPTPTFDDSTSTPTITGTPPTATDSPTISDTPSSTPSQVPTRTPIPGSYHLPLNVAGTQPYTDAQGVSWGLDRKFAPGTYGFVAEGDGYLSSDSVITGTSDPALYQDWREAPVVEYKASVPNGDYAVTLKWAELEYLDPETRVFDVRIQNNLVEPNLDIFALVGANVAYDKEYDVTVTDGLLDISMTASAGVAFVSAIDVRGLQPLPTATPSNTSTITPTETLTSTITPTQTITPTPTDTPPPPDGNFPVAVFSDLADAGTTITAPRPLPVTVYSVMGAHYEIRISPVNEGQWTTIATGTSNVLSGGAAVLDPTLMLNGQYDIQLIATDLSGQFSSDAKVVTVKGDMKIGNFSLAFTDLSVPLAGLPIQLVRSYDSRDKGQGDFGVGWRLAVNSVKLQESQVLGGNWLAGTSCGGVLSRRYTLTSRTSHKVTLTFADGKVFEFQATLHPASSAFVPNFYPSVSFQALPGTVGSLEALDSTDEATLSGDYPDPCDPQNDVELQDAEGGILNPMLYRLTLEDGTQYVIDKVSGLQSITDPHGIVLSMSDTGIHSSTGVGIIFVRDGLGRISSVIDPAGKSLNYAYDGSGNLQAATDRTNNTTQFTYNSTHGLTEIKDPRGITPVKNTYDESGRLLSHTDAYGHTIVYNHDIAGRQEQVTDRNGNVTVYVYDDRGNVLQTTDPLGHTMSYTYNILNDKLTETDAQNHTNTYTYDGNHHVLSHKDPLGHTTSSVYDASGRVVASIDALGHTTSSGYDGSGNLLSSTDALGHTMTMGYDPSGNLSQQADAAGNLTRYSYDDRGHLLSQTDAQNQVTTYTYDANGNRLSETRPSAVGPQLTQYQYDDSGRLTKTIYPDNNFSQIHYNALGKQDSATDELGQVTSYVYDNMGRLTETDFPDGSKELAAYDGENRINSRTDRLNRTTTYVYDTAGHLLSTTYPDGSSTSTAYDAAGRVTDETDELGHVTHTDYNDADQRSAVTDAMSNVTRYEYDANGNQSAVVDPLGHRTTTIYDALNHAIETDLPMTAANGVAKMTTTYDSVGRKATETDAMGKVKAYTYDSLGRLTRVVPNTLNSAHWDYTYDAAGNELTQADALGHTTTFTYDTRNHRLTRSLPLGQTEHYAYDAQGKLTSKTTFNGDTITYGYDPQTNRLTSKSGPGLSVSYSYDAVGQRTGMTDASGSTSFNYDSRGRLTQKSCPEGTLNYTYDAHGNLLSTQSTTSNGLSNSYTYDADNRLSTLTDQRLGAPNGGINTYTYDSGSNLQSFTYPNGISSVYGYDEVNRLLSLSTQNSSGLVSNYVYNLRLDGLRTQLHESGPGTSASIVEWQYDALKQITQEAISGSEGANGSTRYTYDSLGNRLDRQSSLNGISSQDFNTSFDANSRLSSDGSEVLSYDNNGSIVGAGANSFGYDAEGHLVTSTNNGHSIQMLYDGDGNRVAKTVDGTVTTYLVDSNNATGYPQVVEESIGGVLARVYIYDREMAAQDAIGGTGYDYFGHDGLGSTRYLTDANGNVDVKFSFDGFGSLLDTSSGLRTSYLYAGEQWDQDLAMYFMRARYLSVGIGRFWSADSVEGFIQSPISQNLYSYCLNDPSNRTDPSGHESTFGGVDGIWSWIRLMSQGVSFIDMLTDYGTGTISTTPIDQLKAAGYRIEEFPMYYKAENYENKVDHTKGLAAWRLNNPGSINYSTTSVAGYPQFHGRQATSNDRFFAYPTMHLGLGAMVELLGSDLYKDQTVREGWKNYSPSFENNSAGYMDFLDDNGIHLDEAIGPQIQHLREVVPKMEIGGPSGLIIYK